MTKRRDFLKLSGAVSLIPSLSFAADPEKSSGISKKTRQEPWSPGDGFPAHSGGFQPLPYSGIDELSLAKGFRWYPIASRGDRINKRGDTFGDCCDFTAFFPGDNSEQAWLWVNHEYIVAPLVHGSLEAALRHTKEMVDLERKLVGGSLIELRRTGVEKPRWELFADSEKAFRIDGTTPIPLVGPAGGRTAMGTMANCGGGSTPWGTVLSGEENVHDYYEKSRSDGNYGWGKFYPEPAENYGWIVEINPATSNARKLTALGRFAHEGATVTRAKDGRAVVYMGDDAIGRCIYKFISKKKISGDSKKDQDILVEGDLFVANFGACRWEALHPDHPKLKNAAKTESTLFGDLGSILVHTREAAKLVGGTPLNRPEDIKVHPESGVVYFALTNNVSAGDFHGSVVMLEEENSDAASMNFSYDSYAVGGPSAGFSCPDNLTFGPGGTFWVCTDISGSSMGKGAHKNFERNSCVRIEPDPVTGRTYARHFLQAPIQAEITGPSFSADGKTFFLSIQHPGEHSFIQKEGLTSHWPHGGSSVPLSTVIGVEEDGASFSS